MGVFDKFFGRRKNKSQEPTVNWDEMTPLEEFVKRFTDNGGLFLMAENKEDLHRMLAHILAEEGKERYLVLDSAVEGILRESGLPYTSARQPADPGLAFFSSVLYLIRNTGGLLISANQTGGFSWKKLPPVKVFWATPGQLTDNIHTAMEGINRHFRQAYPQQIKTHTHFGSEDFPGQKVYLILYYE